MQSSPFFANTFSVSRNFTKMNFSENKDKIIEKGYSIETPIVITNSANYLDVIETSTEYVTSESKLLTIIF